MSPEVPPDSDEVVIEFIPTAEVPADYAQREKFEAYKTAVRMSRRDDEKAPVFYYTEGEWDAFIAGVKDGEFDDLLVEPPETFE